MAINLLLTAVLLAFIGILTAIEAYTAIKGVPTISERLQWLGKHVPLVTVFVSTIVGMLLIHFFGQPC